MRAGTGDEIWQRPHGADDIQDTIEQQIVPVTWNVSSRKPHFVLSSAIWNWGHLSRNMLIKVKRAEIVVKTGVNSTPDGV